MLFQGFPLQEKGEITVCSILPDIFVLLTEEILPKHHRKIKKLSTIWSCLYIWLFYVITLCSKLKPSQITLYKNALQ